MRTEGGYRVIRGGGWSNPAQALRSANRSFDGGLNYVVGFRVVRTKGAPGLRPKRRLKN